MTERIDRHTGGRRSSVSAVERGTAHAVRLAMISHYRRASAMRANGRVAVSGPTTLLGTRAAMAPESRT